MEYNKLIAGMHTGDDVEGFYVLKDAFLKTTAAGKPFLSGVLADRSGTIDLKVWDYSGPIGANPADTGRIVKIRGQVSEFKGAPQLTAGRIRMADGNDQYDVSALVPVAPIDPDERLQEIRRLIDSMEDADYQSVARTMLERHLEAFRSIPAAKSVHHSFLSGLLMHTSNMLRLADYLSGLYAGIIDRSLLLTGTLLHDFAKEREFTFSGLGMVTDYSLSGQLIGHLVMGAQEVQQCAESLSLPQEKSLLLQHMILSHHGEPDFGAAVRPMCAEFARRAAEQRGSLGVQLGVIPRRRLVVGRGGGSEGKAPIGPHLLHPGLALAAYGQRHGGAHAEDIIDGLRQLLVQVVRAKKAHRDLVRTGEQNPPVLQAPAGIGNPGGQRGALAAQKIVQDRFVAVQVGKKLFAQGGAGDAQRHRQLGKQLTQPALQQQVVVLGNQLIA